MLLGAVTGAHSSSATATDAGASVENTSAPEVGEQKQEQEQGQGQGQEPAPLLALSEEQQKELNTLLFRAVVKDNAEETERVLREGADLESTNKAGITPRQLARDRNQKKCLKFFARLDKGEVDLGAGAKDARATSASDAGAGAGVDADADGSGTANAAPADTAEVTAASVDAAAPVDAAETVPRGSPNGSDGA